MFRYGSRRPLPASVPVLERLARTDLRRTPGERHGIQIRRWRTARQAAGVPTRFLHDCRRTAASNLIRAGVPEQVAMLLTGHKSRAIFDRYNINYGYVLVNCCSNKTYKVRCLLVPSLDPSLPTGLHRTVGVVGGRTSAGSRRVSRSFQACDGLWSAGDQHHAVADSLLPDSREPCALGWLCYSIHGPVGHIRTPVFVKGYVVDISGNRGSAGTAGSGRRVC